MLWRCHPLDFDFLDFFHIFHVVNFLIRSLLAIVNSVVARAHSLLEVAKGAPREATANTSPSKHPWKEQDPNWNPLEVKALINTKRLEHLEELDNSDSCKLMTSKAGKWLHMSALVMGAHVSLFHRYGNTCKSKCYQLLPKYKCIHDYFKSTGTNKIMYWSITIVEQRFEKPTKVISWRHVFPNWFLVW